MNVDDIAPSVPPHIEELSTSCRQFVHAALKLELDFTHETLPLLDHYARSARADLAQRPEALPLVAQAVGAYFGQVIAAELTGLWRAVDGDAHKWFVCLQPVFLAINPVGVAYDVLTLGNHAGPSAQLLLAPQDSESIAARLAALPEEEEDDYHSFSTRFDALQIAADALRGQMQEGGQEDVSFEVQDYVDEFDW